MLQRKTTTLTHRYLLELIDNMSELADSMEQAFGQIHQSFTTFKQKISEIKNKELQELQKLDQVQVSKAENKKKKSQIKKVTKTKKKEEQELLSEDLQNIQNILGEETSLINVDEMEKPTLKQQLGKIQQNLMEKVDLNEGDLFFDELFQGDRHNWHLFYQNEKERLKKIDPKASPADIARFAESQWNKMTQTQKVEWKKNVLKKKEGKKSQLKKDKVVAEISREEKQKTLNTRFSALIERKNAKAQLSTQGIPVHGEKAENVGGRTVSASFLLSALQQNRQKKQVVDTQRVDNKIKRMLNAFQL